MKVGFLGLGVMGKSMAINILKAGYELTILDTKKDSASELIKLGANVVETNAEVARASDIIFTALPNSTIVQEVATGKDGIFEGANEGLIYIDLSSITPKTIQFIQKEGLKKNISVLDAPVSGGAAGATAGSLTIMAGGDKEAFEKALPVLKTMGKKVILVGDIGAGDTIKLVNNLLLGINMVAVAEAFALGVKAGIKAETMYDIISESSGSSYALTAKYNNYISKGNFKPGFAIDLQHKDLELAVETAKDLKMPLPIGNLAQQMLEIARAKGMGNEDISAAIKLYEEWGNIEVRKED